jgi:hypothetical protein
MIIQVSRFEILYCGGFTTILIRPHTISKLLIITRSTLGQLSVSHMGKRRGLEVPVPLKPNIGQHLVSQLLSRPDLLHRAKTLVWCKVSGVYIHFSYS